MYTPKARFDRLASPSTAAAMPEEKGTRIGVYKVSLNLVPTFARQFLPQCDSLITFVMARNESVKGLRWKRTSQPVSKILNAYGPHHLQESIRDAGPGATSLSVG
jgi:hypothetical protein